MKKLAACLIAGSLLIWAARPAYAGGTREITVPADQDAQAEVSFVGTIKVELISVVMPAGDIDFEVDTALPFEISSPGTQITGPDITVENLSVVPIQVEISRVAEIEPGDVIFYGDRFSDRYPQSFRMVDKISEVEMPGTALLALGVKDYPYTERELEQKAIKPGREDIAVTKISAKESCTLQLYGKVAPDFYGAYQFTVKPTLKISAARG